MKLRNKKTDKITEIEEVNLDVKIVDRCCYESFAEYHSLNKEWEDYAPKETLIKDEKIRKAVRAWAEADDLDNFRVQNEHFNCCKIIGYTAGINKASFIGFQATIAHADSKKLYDITELCGEEDE